MFVYSRNSKKYVLPFFFFFLFHLFKIGGNPVGPIFGDGGDMNTQQGSALHLHTDCASNGKM